MSTIEMYLLIAACSIIAVATIVTYWFLYHSPPPRTFYTFVDEERKVKIGVTNFPTFVNRHYSLPPMPPRNQVPHKKIVQEMVVKLTVDNDEILQFLESDDGAKRIIKALTARKPKPYTSLMAEADEPPTDPMWWHLSLIHI